MQKRFNTKNKKIELHKKKKVKKKYNICPKDHAYVILPDGQIDVMRWGLVPAFSKDDSYCFKMINARAETLHEKPSYKDLFLKGQRCLVPADGFYEFPKRGVEKKTYHMHMKDRCLFSFAGLFTYWQATDGSILSTFTIITCPPNDLLQPKSQPAIHDRMPVILDPEMEQQWINTNSNPKYLQNKILAPFPGENMIASPTGDYCRSSKYDGPECWVSKVKENPFDWLER